MILENVRSKKFFGLLEIDIITPEWLQTECNKINFATIFNKISPQETMLSKSMRDKCEKYGVKFPINPQLSLVYNASNYLLTSDTLIFYLDLGMEVKTIHYCIEYQRSKPLKPFIDLSMYLICLLTYILNKCDQLLICIIVTEKRKNAAAIGDNALQNCYKLVGNRYYIYFNVTITFNKLLKLLWSMWDEFGKTCKRFLWV